MLIAIASLLYELAGIQLPTPYCLPGLSLSLHHEQHLERVVTAGIGWQVMLVI